MAQKHVAVVIPAHNEEIYLPGVLDTVCAVDWLKQIIIVDDHSLDGTLQVASNFAQRDSRLSIAQLTTGNGKGAAMLAGVRTLRESVEDVIFMDADLIGMKVQHVEDLYKPLQTNRCDMAVAVFRHGAIRTDAAQILTPYLSGQRCLRRSAADFVLGLLEESGYGVEIGLTIYARKNNWRVEYLPWLGVTHVVQETKHGIIPGLRSRSVMYAQIILTWFRLRNNNKWFPSKEVE